MHNRYLSKLSNGAIALSNNPKFSIKTLQWCEVNPLFVYVRMPPNSPAKIAIKPLIKKPRKRHRGKSEVMFTFIFTCFYSKTENSGGLVYPGGDTAFKALLSARFCAAIWSHISDCDETYNYWEPMHYLGDCE